MNPGDFFQPLSVLMVVGILGALICGWRTTTPYRIWLIVPIVAFLIIWAFTPTVFWPMIRELYGVASGRINRTQGEAILLVRRWMIWDWMRVGVIAIGFLSLVRAISLPLPDGPSQRRITTR